MTVRRRSHYPWGVRVDRLNALVAILLGLVIVLAAADADAQRRRRRRRRQRRQVPTTGQLVILTPQPLHGAEVLIDEEPAGYAPLDPLTLPPGSHTVRVRRAGYTDFSEVTEIEAGGTAEVFVDMVALSMVVTVRSVPDEARVFVDGTFRGNTPIEIELIEGEHSLRVTAPRYRETVTTLTAIAGQTALREFELEAIPESELQPRTLEWYEEPPVWIGVGGGVAAVAAVAVTLAVVLSQDALRDHCGPGPERADCAINIEPAQIGWEF